MRSDLFIFITIPPDIWNKNRKTCISITYSPKKKRDFFTISERVLHKKLAIISSHLILEKVGYYFNEEINVMKKIRINMLSMANSVPGQGVGSAYEELMHLLSEKGKGQYEIMENAFSERSDILHAHTVEPRNYVKMKWSKVPTIGYVHFIDDTMDGSLHLPSFAMKIFTRYFMSFYKAADHLVVVNPAFREELVKKGFDEDRISYIPNFVSHTEFYEKSAKEKEFIRRQYGIEKDRFLVLGVGQTQTRKGVADFVRVAEMCPDVTFLWAGGFSFGPITAGYREIKKLTENPPSNVRFLGIIPREKMNDLYNAADLLFSPSYNELFPMTFLEAAATGTPLLLRDLTCYEDILFHKYLRGTDNDSFAKAIELLKTDESEYRKQVRNAKEISAFYAPDHIYEMWDELYSHLAASQKTPALSEG